jgi:hypothetical protein
MQMVMNSVTTTHQVNDYGSIHQQLSQGTVIWHDNLQALKLYPYITSSTKHCLTIKHIQRKITQGYEVGKIK